MPIVAPSFDGSIFDTVGSYTVGVLWRAGTGTVDPWTKQVQIDEQAAAIAKAKGNDTPTDADIAQAASDVTNTLKLSNSDPSQASIFGNNPGVTNLIEDLKLLGYGLIVLGIAYVTIQIIPLIRRK
jgi:hypothetical protein